MKEIFRIIAAVSFFFVTPFFPQIFSVKHSFNSSCFPVYTPWYLQHFNTYRIMSSYIWPYFSVSCVLVSPGCWLVLLLNPQGRSRLAMCSGVRWIAETLQTVPGCTWVSNMADTVFRITAGVSGLLWKLLVRNIWSSPVLHREVNRPG